MPDPTETRVASGPAAPAVGNGLAFALFLVVTAILFVRPSEVIPAVYGWQIYEAAICLCAMASLPSILRQFRLSALRDRPVTVCVLGLVVAVAFSYFAKLAVSSGVTYASEFGKQVVYYLLLVANVNTIVRLKRFLYWLVGFTCMLTALALLHHHGVIQIPGLEELREEHFDEDNDELVVVERLRSTGIYNDPNDLCLALVTAMAISAYGLCRPGAGFGRVVWLAFLGVFGYALMLTQSRGGMLALLVGVLVFIWARFGWKRGLILSAVTLPALLVLFAGRQTSFDITNRSDTAMSRFQLWNEGLQLFKESPLFGIGYGQYADEVELVAHNSFVHTFTELGFFGGTLFAGAFGCAILGSRKAGRTGDRLTQSLRPCLLAIITAYGVALLSLSRAYVTPTYGILGLGAAYTALAADPPPLRISARFLLRLALGGVATLGTLYLAARFLARL